MPTEFQNVEHLLLLEKCSATSCSSHSSDKVWWVMCQITLENSTCTWHCGKKNIGYSKQSFLSINWSTWNFTFWIASMWENRCH